MVSNSKVQTHRSNGLRKQKNAPVDVFAVDEVVDNRVALSGLERPVQHKGIVAVDLQCLGKEKGSIRCPKRPTGIDNSHR